MNQVKITRNDILGMVAGKQFIPLITAYREVTGVGLKEAKDAIASQTEGIGKERVYNFDGMLNLFLPYLDHDVETLKLRIKDGMDCALDNFFRLGFKDPISACRMVLNNIEG